MLAGTIPLSLDGKALPSRMSYRGNESVVAFMAVLHQVQLATMLGGLLRTVHVARLAYANLRRNLAWQSSRYPSHPWSNHAHMDHTLLSSTASLRRVAADAHTPRLRVRTKLAYSATRGNHASRGQPMALVLAATEATLLAPLPRVSTSRVGCVGYPYQPHATPALIRHLPSSFRSRLRHSSSARPLHSQHDEWLITASPPSCQGLTCFDTERASRAPSHSAVPLTAFAAIPAL